MWIDPAIVVPVKQGKFWQDAMGEWHPDNKELRDLFAIGKIELDTFEPLIEKWLRLQSDPQPLEQLLSTGGYHRAGGSLPTELERMARDAWKTEREATVSAIGFWMVMLCTVTVWLCIFVSL